MTLSEIIYEKPRHLPADKAQEVIGFIDFLLKKSESGSQSVDERLAALTPEQREAYDYLDKIHIDWNGKPIADREEANVAAERAFADSNIVLYALDADQQKRYIAWNLLFSKPCISLQVLNECSNVLNRKRQWAVEDVAEALDKVLRFASVEPSGTATVCLAWILPARYRFSYYDSLFIAAALAAGCTTLYSEDMQHGQVIDGRLTITNPFLK